jgi:hypothetical protein
MHALCLQDFGSVGAFWINIAPSTGAVFRGYQVHWLHRQVATVAIERKRLMDLQWAI